MSDPRVTRSGDRFNRKQRSEAVTGDCIRACKSGTLSDGHGLRNGLPRLTGPNLHVAALSAVVMLLMISVGIGSIVATMVMAGESPATNSDLFRQSLEQIRTCIESGRRLQGTGKTEEARAVWREAFAIHEKLQAQFSNAPEYRRNLALSHINTAQVLLAAGLHQEADKLYDLGFGLFEKLIADAPDRVDDRVEFLRTQLFDWGNALKSAGRLDDAETAFRQVQERASALTAKSPEVAEYRLQLAHSHNGLGHTLWNKRQSLEGEKECRAALALFKKLAVDFPNIAEYQSHVAACNAQLTEFIRRENRPVDLTKQMLRETATRLNKQAAENPDDVTVARELVDTYRELALVCKNNGQELQADQADQRARLSIATSVAGLSLNSLLDLIRQHDEWAVAAADHFDKLVELHPAETVLAICDSLRHPKPEVRRGAVLALVRLLGETEVLDEVQEGPNDHNRVASPTAAKVFGAAGTRAEVVIPALLDASRDDETLVARSAITALGRIGADSEIVICALTAIAHDGSSIQRNIAIATLGQIGPAAKAAVPAVVAALTDDDLTVCAVAKQALQRIDPQRAATRFGPLFDAVAASLHDRATLDVGPGDWPQWGGSRLRNNTPAGKNIPITWDVTSGKNIKWTAKLGSETYGNPCIANGKIFIGTNNGNGYLQRYPNTVDLGVMLCFEEATGKFLWQYSSPKLATGRVHDWPQQGMPSTPVADGQRLWGTTNRGEIVCLDAEGFHDNENDGPFRDEANENKDEADVIWRFDMIKELGVSPHNMSNCSILMADGILFICTSNGVDEGHQDIPAPDAPSFIAMDRDTGKVLWTDKSPGRNILHAQWASPSYGVFGGQPQVLFPGGDGWLYSFDPHGDGQGNSKLLWKFDCNPKKSLYTLTRATRNSLIGFACIYDGLVYVAVGEDPEHGEGQGHLWCIDPTKRGDVSPTIVYNSENPNKPIPHRRIQALDEKAGDFERENPNSAAVWHYVGEDSSVFETTMHRTMGTVAVSDDLLYVLDFSGLFHCVNAKSGKAHWTYDTFAECWGSPLIVEEHVYIGDTDGDVVIFNHSADIGIAAPEGIPPAEINLETSISSTPVVANNVLCIVTRNMLYAIEAGE